MDRSARQPHRHLDKVLGKCLRTRPREEPHLTAYPRLLRMSARQSLLGNIEDPVAHHDDIVAVFERCTDRTNDRLFDDAEWKYIIAHDHHLRLSLDERRRCAELDELSLARELIDDEHIERCIPFSVIAQKEQRVDRSDRGLC